MPVVTLDDRLAIAEWREGFPVADPRRLSERGRWGDYGA
jgi:hypothetical protein